MHPIAGARGCRRHRRSMDGRKRARCRRSRITFSQCGRGTVPRAKYRAMNGAIEFELGMSRRLIERSRNGPHMGLRVQDRALFVRSGDPSRIKPAGFFKWAGSRREENVGLDLTSWPRWIAALLGPAKTSGKRNRAVAAPTTPDGWSLRRLAHWETESTLTAPTKPGEDCVGLVAAGSGDWRSS